MNTTELARKRCAPCEGGVPPLASNEVNRLLQQVAGWSVADDGKKIRRSWRVKDFLTAIDFFQRIATIAEAQDHHPDLHLEGYRNVTIEIWTHAVGGLTENDFILAAQINELPVELRS